MNAREITTRLKNVCTEYAEDRKWYRFGFANAHTEIANQIIKYLNTRKNTHTDLLELSSACIVYALMDMLKTVNSDTFKKILENEFKDIQLPDFQQDNTILAIIKTINVQLQNFTTPQLEDYAELQF